MTSQNRLKYERDFWDWTVTQKNFVKKYISDFPVKSCQRAIGNLGNGRVLEIGCGVGRLMKEGYVGVDISENMIVEARKRRPDCQFWLGDGYRLPFQDEVFGGVYSVLLFQHIPLETVQSYILEARRVLKKNGVFVFQFVNSVGVRDSGGEKLNFKHSITDIHNYLLDNGYDFIGGYPDLVHNDWYWMRVKKI